MYKLIDGCCALVKHCQVCTPSTTTSSPGSTTAEARWRWWSSTMASSSPRPRCTPTLMCTPTTWLPEQRWVIFVIFVIFVNQLTLSQIKFLALGDTLELQLTSLTSGCQATRITMCVSLNEEWLWPLKYSFLLIRARICHQKPSLRYTKQNLWPGFAFRSRDQFRWRNVV